MNFHPSLLVLGLVATATIPAMADTVPLSPGQTVSLSGATTTFPVGTLVLSTGPTAFSIVDSSNNVLETGTLSEDIYNVGGELDFLYQVANTSSTGADSFERFTVSNFTGYQTSVGYVPSVSGDAPDSATEQSNGSAVGINLFSAPIAPGTSSDWVEVQTNATAIGAGAVSVIDSYTANVADFGPEAVPEPSTWALLSLTGLAGLLFHARRRLS